jgi:short-subunit dehydrogenase
MRRELRGKRFILTGASSGIGRRVAHALAAEGVKLAFAARSTDKLAVLESELCNQRADAIGVVCDVTKPEDREHLIATAVGRWGGLDGLINNAGVAAWGHFQTSTEEINRTTLEVNFFGPVELIRLAVPHLTHGVQPVVVNVTSMCGRRGMPAWPEYSASKFALVGMAEALRAEFVRFGVEVVTILPGLTNSDLNRHLLRNEGRADIRYDRGMAPEYVASRIVEAIRRNRREVVLGREARLMLLANRFFPRLLGRLIARRVTRLYQ